MENNLTNFGKFQLCFLAWMSLKLLEDRIAIVAIYIRFRYFIVKLVKIMSNNYETRKFMDFRFEQLF